MNQVDIKIINEKLKKNDIILIILTILIGIAVGFFAIAVIGSKRDVKYTYLNDLIVKKENNNLKNSYLEIHSTPYVFAEYDDTSTRFYIVQDENYLYIVYLAEDNYEKILDTDLENKPYRIEGYTEKIPDDVRDLAIEAYNELVEEEVITVDNFKSYFGNIYLNTTNIYHGTDIFFMLAITIGIVGVLGFIIMLKQRKDSIRCLRQFNNKELKNIGKELNLKSTIIYKKEKLYLTKSYIIIFLNSIDIIKYSNILWIYKQEYKYGFKNKQSLIIVTKDGIKHIILNLQLSDDSNKIIDDVVKKISKKTSKVLVGYTEENNLKAKSLYEVD